LAPDERTTAGFSSLAVALMSGKTHRCYHHEMFGSHLSIAGGMHNALLSAEKLGFDTVQVFTCNCSLPNG
jgi:hypothetical protein